MSKTSEAVRGLFCYMNIPKYSKLFVQIVRKCMTGKRLSRKVIVREMSVTHECDVALYSGGQGVRLTTQW